MTTKQPKPKKLTQEQLTALEHKALKEKQEQHSLQISNHEIRLTSYESNYRYSAMEINNLKVWKEKQQELQYIRRDRNDKICGILKAIIWVVMFVGGFVLFASNIQSNSIFWGYRDSNVYNILILGCNKSTSFILTFTKNINQGN